MKVINIEEFIQLEAELYDHLNDLYTERTKNFYEFEFNGEKYKVEMSLTYWFEFYGKWLYTKHLDWSLWRRYFNKDDNIELVKNDPK